MINNLKDLYYYLECDQYSLGKVNQKHPRLFGDDIWKYQIILRKFEYYFNTRRPMLKLLYHFKHHFFGRKLFIAIPINVCGPGLAIVHEGNIIIHPNAHIGDNFRIHECVTIGATNGSDKAALIGNNVFVGTGAKIIGAVQIGNGVCIGANAVVVNNIEQNITIGGIPAKKISNNNSTSNLIKGTEIYRSIHNV